MNVNVATSRFDEVRGDVVIKRDSPFPDANLPANATLPDRTGSVWLAWRRGDETHSAAR